MYLCLLHVRLTCIRYKYVLYFKLYFKVCAVVQSTATGMVRLGFKVKTYLTKTYFKNVLKNGYINPLKSPQKKSFTGAVDTRS